MKLETHGISGTNAIGNILNINCENTVWPIEGVQLNKTVPSYGEWPGKEVLARTVMQVKIKNACMYFQISSAKTPVPETTHIIVLIGIRFVPKEVTFWGEICLFF